ncbi:hypothetical protein PaeCFBP13512_18405 [Paenibacillus sp. CFBP13512]|uniref:hypothetical protein n=1 Tax=Paenibacillus sp. CFBP13512 TaxID=2184007 RepID=UPI0010C03095|nr:hypothetical protein [Paenibacillus sp. CFBP13512]TKJ87195.1 hypothetical protein PaeCFBP13512_18405 [Paenibacillus sp. CFBP13512]
MDWLREYKEFFILATTVSVVIGWLITYISSRKLKQQEVFHERTEKSITTILGPIVKELKAIIEENHEQSRFRKLKQFVELYDGIESPLFLSTSRELVKQFDFVVQEYQSYNKVSSQENYNALWSSILSLQKLSNEKFDEHTDFLFRHYDWKYEVAKKNILIQVLIYTLKFMKNIMQGLAQIVFISLFAILIIDSITYPFLDFFMIKSYMVSDRSYLILALFAVFPISWFLNYLDKYLFGSKSKKKSNIKRNDKLISSNIETSPHLFLNSSITLDEIQQKNNEDNLVPNQNK